MAEAFLRLSGKDRLMLLASQPIGLAAQLGRNFE